MDGFQSPERRSPQTVEAHRGRNNMHRKNWWVTQENASQDSGKVPFLSLFKGKMKRVIWIRGSFWQLSSNGANQCDLQLCTGNLYLGRYTISDMFFNIIVTGSANLIFTVIAIFTVDKLGRRALMRFEALSLTLIYLVMGCCYFFEIKASCVTARRPGPLPVTPYRWEP